MESMNLFSDEFTNLNATIEIDWSTINGAIVYTIEFSSSTLLTSSTDASTVTLKPPLNITMITTTSQFKFDEHSTSKFCIVFDSKAPSAHTFKKTTAKIKKKKLTLLNNLGPNQLASNEAS